VEGVKPFCTYSELQQAPSAEQLLLSTDLVLLVGHLRNPDEQLQLAAAPTHTAAALLIYTEICFHCKQLSHTCTFPPTDSQRWIKEVIQSGVTAHTGAVTTTETCEAGAGSAAALSSTLPLHFHRSFSWYHFLGRTNAKAGAR